MANVSLHVEATHRWEDLKPFLRQPGIQSVLLLNANPEQIQYCLDNCSGLITVRVYDPFNEANTGLGENFEKDIMLRHQPWEFVAFLNRTDIGRFKGNKRVRYILGWNEPYYRDGKQQKDQLVGMIAVATAMIEAGYGVALLGVATDKSLQIVDVENGVWDNLIDFAIDNSDWVHLDCHEYELTRPANQFLKSYPVPFPHSIIDPASMAFENWGRIPYSGDGIKTNYHIGRIALLLDRAMFRRGKHFFWTRGEMGYDTKTDGPLDSFVKNIFTPKFGFPMGLNSLRKLFEFLLGGRPLTDKEFDIEVYRDMHWWTSQDPKSCLGNYFFAWNGSPRWASCDVSNGKHSYLLSLLGAQQAEGNGGELPPELPTIDFAQPYSVFSKNANNIIIRTNPTTAAPQTGVYVTPAPQFAFIPKGDYPHPQADGYSWAYLSLSGFKGWVAERLVQFTAVNNSQCEAELEAAKIELASLKAQLAKAKAKLEGIASVLNS